MSSVYRVATQNNPFRRQQDPDDPSVGLINGELSIPGNLLRREVFDPVVDQVRACNFAARVLLALAPINCS